MSIGADLVEFFGLVKRVNELLASPDRDERWPEIIALIDREEVLFERLKPELLAMWPVTPESVRH